MQFSRQWSDDGIDFYAVSFTPVEIFEASVTTGLDLNAFRGMHVFHHEDGEHSLDKEGRDPKAVAYMEPLVVAALNRRDEAFARFSAWHTAKRQGWQVMDASGAPVPEPTFRDESW